MSTFPSQLRLWTQKSCLCHLDNTDLEFLKSFFRSEFTQFELNPQFIQSLLKDDRLFYAVLESPNQLLISPQLYFYILVQKALTLANINDPLLIDYIVFLLVSNIKSQDTNKDEGFFYLFDQLKQIDFANNKEKFYLRIELANKILFLTSLFQAHLHYRTERKSAPNLSFYEAVGSTQYNAATKHPLATELHLTKIFLQLAYCFSTVRQTLNQFSERFVSLGEPFIANLL